MSRGVTARDVRKSFAAPGRTLQVLKGVDLELAAGEVVGLIGPNGAGKTTLMSCLLGFLRPDDGAIHFDGSSIADPGIRKRIGFVPERLNFGRRITGWQFVRYLALLSGLPRATVNARVDAMLERLGMSGAANQPLRQYSRGMLQRIALCQALIHEPDFVFLDEPASGLDPNGVLLVRDLIAGEKRRGAMVFLNSHQLSEVEKVCDRVLFLRDGVVSRAETLRHGGVVVAIRFLPGSADTAVVERITGSRVDQSRVVVSRSSEAEIATLVRELVLQGVAVVDVRPHTADLEGIFRGDS